MDTWQLKVQDVIASVVGVKKTHLQMVSLHNPISEAATHNGKRIWRALATQFVIKALS